MLFRPCETSFTPPTRSGRSRSRSTCQEQDAAPFIFAFRIRLRRLAVGPGWTTPRDRIMEGVCRTKAFTQILVVCLALSLLGCGADVNQKPSPGAAKQFLKLRGYNFDDKSFLSAAAANDVLAVNAFIAAGINPNARNEESGAPVLVSAAAHGDVEIVKALLTGGANVNERDGAGYTALLRALQNKEDEVADLLLAQQNLDLNAQGSNGVTVLMSYVGRDSTDVVKSLLARKADVNLQDADGDTALH